MEFDGVTILTESGDKQWTWEEFVKELKSEAGEGIVQILTSDTTTTIHKGTAAIVLFSEKERKFWEAMDKYGWPSGMHPRVVRKNYSE